MPLKEETIKVYHERINRVLLYINEHLDNKLDLAELASVSGFSGFHFHRIMRAHLNESIGNYIFRLRLDIAARLITYSDMPLNEIAWKVGYECPSSFSKAFRKRFNISPQDFRDSCIESRNYDVSFNKSEVNMELKTKIKELNDKKVVFIQSIGEYSSAKTGETWDKLMSYAKKNRLFGWKTECLGISHDDPAITEADKCRYDACLVVTKDVKPDGEVGVKTIRGGKYAIFKVKGPYSELEKAYTYIFKSWLPKSGHELRDTPSFEKYLNNPNRTKPEKLKTEIYLPLK